MEVKYEEACSLQVSQAASITKMVEKFNQVDTKTVMNPCVMGEELLKAKVSTQA
jgi:hypothetical protein